MRIGILGCKGTTLDLIHNIRLRGELEIDQVVTLGAKKAHANRVAHYEAGRIAAYCSSHGLPLHTVKSYDLSDPEDQFFFRKASLDLLLVIGWERLLPNEVLKSLRHFACGMHGSAYGLPRGRGRSPMNWAILTGHSKFITYLFRYTQGMDDGDIIGFKVFDITPYDDIGSLHTKNRIAMGELLHSYAPKIADGSLRVFPQPDDEPTYYPKRTHEDGVIDWAQSTEVIHRLVRAVAPPYPGAMTRLGDLDVPILAGQPFDSGLFDPSIAPGTVVDVNLSLNRLVVKTGDSAYLINDVGDFDLASLALGDRFDSVSQDAVLRQIRSRYPEWVRPSQRVI